MKKLLLAGVALAAMTAVSYAADTYVVGMKGPGAGNPFWAAVEKGAKVADVVTIDAAASTVTWPGRLRFE